MIEFEAAGFQYHGAGEIFAELTLTLAPGTFHFLTGPSGSGKTTFLKLCTLSLMPTSGEIEVFGTSSKALDRNGVAAIRQKIGVVHQDCTFLDHLTVEANVRLPLMFAQNDKKVDAGEIRDLMAWVGLSERAGAFPPELSGGERQRAALARAVVLTPDIVVADEPTGNVDWDMGLRLMELLAELNRNGRSVIVATHDLNLVRATAKMVPSRSLRITGKDVVQAETDL